VQDRLTTHRDELTSILSSSRSLIYVCGIAGMELGILQQLARTLTGDALDALLQIDPEARGTINAWDRKMLHKQVKPTRRVFLEVY
jgi:ferredoxin--NADP+ reductase